MLSVKQLEEELGMEAALHCISRNVSHTSEVSDPAVPSGHAKVLVLVTKAA